MSTTVIPYKAPQAKLSLAVVKTTVVSKRKKKKKSSPRRSKTLQASSSPTFRWLQSLNDPFSHAGPRLGWGNMMPSNIYRTYTRGTIATNADGSFGLILTPDATQMVFANNAGASTATWSSKPAVNAAGLLANASEARVISGGLRCIANVAATSVPGVMFTGYFKSTNVTNINGQTPSTMATYNNATLGIGRNGTTGFVRPVDPSSFIFLYAYVGGFPNAQLFDVSVPWIAGLGFPASAVIYYEAVINYEFMSGDGSTAIPDDPTTLDSSTPSDEFSSPEQAVKAIRSDLLENVHNGELPPATDSRTLWSRVMDGGRSVADAYLHHSNLINHFGRSILRGSSVFGGGSALGSDGYVLEL